MHHYSNYTTYLIYLFAISYGFIHLFLFVRYILLRYSIYSLLSVSAMFYGVYMESINISSILLIPYVR